MQFIKIEDHKFYSNVILNRPDVRNAFNPQMIQEITDTFKSLQVNKNYKAIVLKGEGKAFCAGGDLSWMQQVVNYSYEQNKQDAEKLFEMFQVVFSCPIPIVGIAHGSVFGGGLGLLACCDYVLAEEKTQFCFSEVKLGISPAVISAFVLKKCTFSQVGHLMISGKIFNAQEAVLSGLAHQMLEEDLLHDQLETVLNLYKDVGPEASRITKKLLQNIMTLNEQEIKEEVTETIADRRVSIEGQEGLNSFLQKRKPKWRAL